MFYTEIWTRKVELWIFTLISIMEKTLQINVSHQNFSIGNNLLTERIPVQKITNRIFVFFFRQVPNLELREKVTPLLSKDHFKYFRKNPLDLLPNNVNLIINRILDDGLNSSYKITKIFFHNTRV